MFNTLIQFLAVYIEAYTAARVFGDNFIQIQTSTMGRTEMNQRIELTCQVEGYVPCLLSF